MAAYISFQPSDYYSTKLYTATGSADAITGVGFEPDLVWIKDRTLTGYPSWMNVLSGPTYNLFSNTTAAQANGLLLTSFDSDGYTLGGSNGDTNTSGRDYASWNWKAGTTSGIATNGSTTITPTAYSFNQTAGFSIIAYTGNSTNDGQKVPHGLGATPDFIITKQLGTTSQWSCYQRNIGNTKAIILQSTAAEETDAGTGSWNYWYRTDPDSVNFTIGSSHYTNPSSAMVAYCFTSIRGYSKFGEYTGNANADGPFVHTGFRPAFVTIKNANAVQAWNTFDDKRSTSTKNVTNFLLQPNDSAAETTGVDGVKTIDLLSNGFKVRGLNNEINKSGDMHIYMAFAEFPLVSSNSKSGVAR